MRTATHSYDATGWNPLSDNFSTEYTYDWNGNLLFLQSKDQTGDLMHHICYNYTDTTKNRLSGIFATGLNSGTYQYDALGNLVRDNAEGLTVGWNALGKVDTIRRNGNILSTFRYSPTGQRQVKTDSSGTTYYIHDATGNVMCVYRLKNDTLTASERYIYGSKRLGLLGQQVWITAGGAARLQDRNTIGHRLYELTDHLGNVAVTFPDQKWLTHDANNEPIYQLEVSSFTDYYPFGFPMPVRSFNTGGYRYFFNGQEGDDEVFGEGALHAFEYRMHDTRIGRFWSVDPLAGKFPWNSTYAFAENMPVGGMEFEGLEVVAAFSRSQKNLAIIPDVSEVNPSLSFKWVSAEKYSKLKPSQKRKYNYGIYVENVFSGGHVEGNTIMMGDQNHPNEIPIPLGVYNILENKGNDNPSHDKFFVLDPQDDKPYNKVDDREGVVNAYGEQRRGYNLHPGTVSHGCVTASTRVPDMSEEKRLQEWDIIYEVIINTTTEKVPDNRGKHKYIPFTKQIKFGKLYVIE